MTTTIEARTHCRGCGAARGERHPGHCMVGFEADTRIIVEVSGGCVQSVYANLAREDISVDLIDHDNFDCVSDDGAHFDEGCSDHEAEDIVVYLALQAETKTLTEVF